jgi:hypothetical protein
VAFAPGDVVVKIEITKRSKVRRNYLTYMRERTGKSARLSSVAFDRDEVNTVEEAPEENSAELTENKVVSENVDSETSEKPAEIEEKPQKDTKKSEKVEK